MPRSIRTVRAATAVLALALTCTPWPATAGELVGSASSLMPRLAPATTQASAAPAPSIRPAPAAQPAPSNPSIHAQRATAAPIRSVSRASTTATPGRSPRAPPRG